MHRIALRILVVLMLACSAAMAASFVFNTDPFEGAALTPGRDVIGGEASIAFNIATDQFVLDPAVFGISDPPSFLADSIANIPASGPNVIVIQDTPTPFAAGIAATAIAGQITAPGPGFFIYFNSGLDLPRLVFSTDLSDPTADLKVLFRMTNLGGQPGRDALPTFTAGNFLFAAVPEPGSILMMASGLVAALGLAARRRRE